MQASRGTHAVKGTPSGTDSGTPRTKWNRSQRFQLSPAGREAGLNYHQVIVASRAEAGRKSFDVARTEWAAQLGLEPADVGKIMQGYDGMPKGFLASMAHDILAGKPIEVDHLSGVVVRLGSQTGVPTPSHKFITQALAPFATGKPAV